MLALLKRLLAPVAPVNPYIEIRGDCVYGKLTDMHYRGVTAEEVERRERVWEWVRQGLCPDCKSHDAKLLAGPRGGMSTNFKCEVCEARFNVHPFGGCDRL